jgi:enoyl-[acyl-carrier protein] reductase III
VIRPLQELTEKHWDWTLDANARSLLTLVRLAVPTMPAGGAIVALSSLGSQRVLDDYLVVGVSKAALEALIRYLAVELAPRGIRANAVSAGLVETEALDYFPKREEMLAFYRGRTPAGRLVEPEHIADAVCFLASPEASMIRGQTLVVDGGYSLLA